MVTLLISFRSFLGPVILAVILSYLLYPWTERIQRMTHIPWRLVAGILYLLVQALLFGLLTWGGITLVEQIQNLIHFLQGAINDLPNFIDRVTATPQVIGPFTLDWQRLDLAAIINQLLGIIQPVLSQAGILVGTLATSAAGIVGWTIFTLVLSYFIVSETQGGLQRLIHLPIPGYREDFRRIEQELSIIWNAFLRGQLILFTLTTTIYTITFGILGVRYYFGLALLAGFARFLPYIGPLISWTTDSIVAFSQGYTLFGLTPAYYMLVVLGTAWVTDTIIDNLISPQIFSNALKIHPAAVIVCALLGFNLMGIIGIVLAAPVLATLKLIFDYTLHKLLDLDPWADLERALPPLPLHQMAWQCLQSLAKTLRLVTNQVRTLIQRLRKSMANH
jgi:predicted PurR-regulated permease PerM